MTAKTLNQSTDNTTLNEEQTSSDDSGIKVLETAICHCGKEYPSKRSISFPFIGKETIVTEEECGDCRDKKFREEEERERREEEEYQKRMRKDRYFRDFSNDSLVNPKLKQATFETYQPTNDELKKAKAICERYVDKFDLKNPVNLLLIGNYGTGKSHLSVSISMGVIDNHAYSALFVSTPKLLTKIRSTYNRNSHETEEDIIDQLSRVTLLVLDDIGSEQSKPTNDDNEQSWATSKIFEIIDNRIGKHTIFTSNFTIPELQQRMGGRNFSRMMESTHIVKMYGDDYRLKDFK